MVVDSIDDLEFTPVAGGAFGAVYEHCIDDRAVAVKVYYTSENLRNAQMAHLRKLDSSEIDLVDAQPSDRSRGEESDLDLVRSLKILAIYKF